MTDLGMRNFIVYLILMNIKITGYIFLIIGVTSLFIQKMFYGYLDADGVLHDSIFLPLGVFSLIIGVLILIIKYIFQFIKKY